MVDIVQLSKSDELFDGRYRLLRPLSMDGATADVWLAVDMNTIDKGWEDSGQDKKDETGMMVAIKIYRPKNALDIEGEQRFRDEFKIVYECRHANLLQPTEFSIYKDCPYLVLPYCKYGSSEQLIGKKLSDAEIWKFIMDVSSGLQRLHSYSPQIVHQDIKPANIMIDNTKNFAITDFGISSKSGGVSGYYYDEENSGTLAYMAPERFNSDAEPMPQSDIWAFGATLCEILTGRVPYGEGGGKSQMEGEAMISLTGVSTPFQRLIHACLEKEAGNRPTAQQLIEAARTRQFPPKKRWPIFAAVALILMIFLGVLWWWNRPPSTETLYEEALTMMQSNNAEVFMQGYQQMEQLSRVDYVPALYEMALTRGWDASTESLRRKKILGIQVSDDEKDDYLPVSDVDNQNAMFWLNRILDIKDSAYPKINAYAAYRLAGYYFNSTPALKKRPEEAKSMLVISKKWAEKAGDKKLLKAIEDAFEQINSEIE